MGPLEDALGLTIKHKLTNMTLNISQPELIRKMTEVFIKDMKLITTFNNPTTSYKEIVCQKKTPFFVTIYIDT